MNEADDSTFEKRMGWSFTWLSSGRTDFNYDFGASFGDDQLVYDRHSPYPRR